MRSILHHLLKTSPCRRRRLRAYVFDGRVGQLRQLLRHQRDVSRLVALPPVRMGRQVRRIGFKHQPVEPELRRQRLQTPSILKRHRAAQPKRQPQIIGRLRLGQVARESVPDAEQGVRRSRRDRDQESVIRRSRHCPRCAARVSPMPTAAIPATDRRCTGVRHHPGRCGCAG